VEYRRVFDSHFPGSLRTRFTCCYPRPFGEIRKFIFGDMLYGHAMNIRKKKRNLHINNLANGIHLQYDFLMKTSSHPLIEDARDVGIWIRVSSEEQAKGDAPEHHLERAKMYAKARGWNIVEVYDLAGQSGKSVMAHPEAKRMMEDVKRGHVKAILFSKLARLSRNLREVQDFGDFFRQNNADLVSLNESIDTSTAGGRMFFHLLGVFAQWEREEIVERVNASVITRAKLGKPINGQVPYGYRLENRKLVPHPDEAPVRRQAYELFRQHRRKGTVAKLLNASGFRTREGKLWRDMHIRRILPESSAKGIYYFNRIKKNGPNGKEEKPESEWGQMTCEPIVPEALWNEVNQIIEEQGKVNRFPGKLPSHTFSNIAWCKCGGKMYVRSGTPKYLCRKCNNKIPIVDLEGIFQEELEVFFTAPEKIASHLSTATKTLTEKEQLLTAQERSIQKIREEMSRTHRLFVDGHITGQGFGEFYKPAEQQLNQLTKELPRLQAEVDYLKINHLSADVIVKEARLLYGKWPSLPTDEKRKIAENLCQKIVIGADEIDITLSYLPSSEEQCKNQQQL
jgi:site-specific DNA recombinase